MSKMKEAIMEITEYIMENMEEYFTPENTPSESNMFETIQNFVMDMDEETFYVTLMLATPSRKENQDEI